MEIVTGSAALCTATERWGVVVRVLAGRGPGRHPFAQPDAPDFWGDELCELCGEPEHHPVHRAPARRKLASFVKSATVARHGGRDFPGV